MYLPYLLKQLASNGLESNVDQPVVFISLVVLEMVSCGIRRTPSCQAVRPDCNMRHSSRKFCMQHSDASCAKKIKPSNLLPVFAILCPKKIGNNFR